MEDKTMYDYDERPYVNVLNALTTRQIYAC